VDHQNSLPLEQAQQWHLSSWQDNCVGSKSNWCLPLVRLITRCRLTFIRASQTVELIWELGWMCLIAHHPLELVPWSSEGIVKTNANLLRYIWATDRRPCPTNQATLLLPFRCGDSRGHLGRAANRLNLRARTHSNSSVPVEGRLRKTVQKS